MTPADLQRIRSTGENTVGEGLAKTDPSINITGRH